MKKSVYLKLSQQEANKKLQLSLFEHYNRIKQKSCVLGYLYFPFAYIAFSSIAIVSFGYRVVTLFQDIRFAPHYMKTVIEYNNMSPLQANEYLDSQLLEYKKRLSYGNISVKEKNSIDITFSLLYDEYKLPVSDDKHEEIISNISNLQGSIYENNKEIKDIYTSVQDVGVKIEEQGSVVSNNFSILTKSMDEVDTTLDAINSNIKIVTSTINDHSINVIDNLKGLEHSVNEGYIEIKTVSNYTNRKEIEEKNEQERLENHKIEQEKRQTTAYNREKGKKLSSFESALSEKQIKILTSYCNRIPVFDRDIELQEMKDILLCTHTKPLKVTVNKYIALLFTELYNNKLIWKSVAERYKCFVSSENKILNSNDLYMANQTSGLIEQKVYDLLEDCIEEIVSSS